MTEAPASIAGCAILLVEDDYFIVKHLRRQLGQAGATILGPASNVPDALELVRTLPRVDAAVLDINLQGEMVFPVADALAMRGVPFVLATGYDAASIPPRHAAVRHCSKPIDAGDLVRALFA